MNSIFNTLDNSVKNQMLYSTRKEFDASAKQLYGRELERYKPSLNQLYLHFSVMCVIALVEETL